ncbi:MAG: ATP-binding protein [Bacteroidota bacterium]
MRPKPKKRFTLKIIVSYLVLAILASLAGYLVFSEFQTYNAIQNQATDNKKLLHTNLLLAELHEAENLSKLALHTGKPKTFKAYSMKVDSIGQLIDSLEVLTPGNIQEKRLDSVRQLLIQKAYNTAELRKIRLESEQYAPADSLLKALKKMETDMGRITPENLVANFDALPAGTQKSIREYVDLLNENIPKNSNASEKEANIDSLFQFSKSVLIESKIRNSRLKQSLAQKEVNIFRTDLELSQKLRAIISSLEKEIHLNSEIDRFQKQKLIQRSIWFGGIAAFLGLFVVVVFTILISNDYLKVQRYRDQLEKEKMYSESLLKSREQLISTVSHDLKSPLATLRGYTDLLGQKNAKKKSLRYIGHMKSALIYVDTLLSDLLDFSRLEDGQLPLEKKSFFLPELVNTVASQYQDNPNKKGITFSWTISHKLHTPIVSDPNRLSQVLNNLIGNAFKYTKEGFVKIEALVHETKKGPYVKIKVMDSGIGIKKEKQSLIFEEFTQADDSIYGKYGGYGLGLTIAQKISGLLGGYLELESIENKGSTFSLFFPLEYGFLEEVHPEAISSSSSKTPSLLIFEDDKALLELLLEICKSKGIQALGFHSFEEMKIPPDFYYSIVLTDINLPDIDGFEVLNRLKSGSYQHYANQPIIAMTGQRNLENRVYIEYGFAAILPKPFSADTLLDAFQTMYSSDNSYTIKPRQLRSVNNPPLFNLQPISSFVDNQEALESVLATFLQTNLQNLELLDEAITRKDIEKMKSISHQMLPMFRQLEVKEAIPILEQMEVISKKTELSNTLKEYLKLKATFLNLEEEIRRYVFKHPIGTD